MQSGGEIARSGNDRRITTSVHPTAANLIRTDGTTTSEEGDEELEEGCMKKVKKACQFRLSDLTKSHCCIIMRLNTSGCQKCNKYALLLNIMSSVVARECFLGFQLLLFLAWFCM